MIPQFRPGRIVGTILQALLRLADNGIIVRTGSGTVTSRALEGTTNQVSVANGDATGGNPRFSTPQDIHTSADVRFGTARIGAAAIDGTVTIRRSTAGRTFSVRNTADDATTLFMTDAGLIQGASAVLGATSTITSPGTLTIVRAAAFNSEGNASLRFFNAASSPSVALQMGADPVNGMGYIQAMHPGVAWTTVPLGLQANGGNVLIGTNAVAGARLHVRGTGLTTGFGLRIENSAGTARLLVRDDGQATFSGLAGTGTGIMTVDASGVLSSVRGGTSAQYLRGDGTLATFPTTMTPAAHTLDSHSNVTIASNTDGEILRWNGTAWVNNTLAEAGIASTSHSHAAASLPAEEFSMLLPAEAEAGDGQVWPTMPQRGGADVTWQLLRVIVKHPVIIAGETLRVRVQKGSSSGAFTSATNMTTGESGVQGGGAYTDYDAIFTDVTAGATGQATSGQRIRVNTITGNAGFTRATVQLDWRRVL